VRRENAIWGRNAALWQKAVDKLIGGPDWRLYRRQRPALMNGDLQAEAVLRALLDDDDECVHGMGNAAWLASATPTGRRPYLAIYLRHPTGAERSDTGPAGRHGQGRPSCEGRSISASGRH
jgi:hypothetical protein